MKQLGKKRLTLIFFFAGAVIMKSCFVGRRSNRIPSRTMMHRCFYFFYYYLYIVISIHFSVASETSFTASTSRAIPLSSRPPLAATVLSPVEASVRGESALIDKETGRIFWEKGGGGGRYSPGGGITGSWSRATTLSAATFDKLGIVGMLLGHTKASLLTILLFAGLFGLLAAWLRQQMQQERSNLFENLRAPLLALLLVAQPQPQSQPQPQPQQENSAAMSAIIADNALRALISAALFAISVAEWTILHAPKLMDLKTVFVVALFYLAEAYCSNTRQYLSNTVVFQNSAQVEDYLERLRKEPPVVAWSVRSFHYEEGGGHSTNSNGKRSPAETNGVEDESSLLGSLKLPNAIISNRLWRRSSDSPTNDTSDNRVSSSSVSSWWGRFKRKKTVTYEATQIWQPKYWVDKTMVGVWQRAFALGGDSNNNSNNNNSGDGDDDTNEELATAAAPFTKVTLSNLLVLSNAKARQGTHTHVRMFWPRCYVLFTEATAGACLCPFFLFLCDYLA